MAWSDAAVDWQVAGHLAGPGLRRGVAGIRIMPGPTSYGVVRSNLSSRWRYVHVLVRIAVALIRPVSGFGGGQAQSGVAGAMRPPSLMETPMEPPTTYPLGVRGSILVYVDLV